MKCSVVLVLWVGLELVQGGALRCVPGEDSVCAADNLETVHPARIGKALSGKVIEENRGVYCLIGSKWDSTCGKCSCSEFGRAQCERRAGCTATDEDLEKQCAPDTMWLNACNSCWCSDQGRAMCTRIGCAYVTEPTKETQSEEKPSKDTKTPVSESNEQNNNQTKMNAVNKKNITRRKSENQPRVDIVDDTDHPDVESAQESLESLDHSFEELDYNIQREMIDLNRVPSIQEQDNILEETFQDEKRHSLLKRSVYQLREMFPIPPTQEQDNMIEEASQEKKRHSLLKRSVCKPGEVFQAECNACKCAPDGQSYVCTHNECMEGKKNDEVEVFMETEGVDHVEHHMVCAARGTFYIGCNTCHCNPLGTDYSCSNKPCPLPEDVELFHELKTLKSSTNRSTKQVCVANRMFIKDCNTCWCNDDGTSFYCTRKVCVPDLPEPGQDQPEELRLIKKECRPNEVFELDCNMCRCNPDGNSYSCTRRACVDMDHHDQPVVEPVVQDAKLLAAQNTKVDPVDVLDQSFAEPVQDIKVVPVVQDTKNLPTVSASVVEGKEVLPIDKQVVQPVDQPMFDVAVKDAENQPLVRKSRATEEKQCNPGQNFRLDCNICLCDNTGTDFSCTRHDCNAPNGGDLSRSKRETSESSVENVTMQCVAGSVFDRECNVCRCAEGGQRALCTHKPCSPRAQPLAIDSVTNAPESDPNFRCNPGEQLKRGCNDCQCSADGRSVFCTVRFCDQDITPPPSTV
ncbi:hypothetical protein O0L34_g10057 [Tuta absoluta]|nr:hypothetical protein O0L34_g10057 [Tuta absoluta]